MRLLLALGLLGCAAAAAQQIPAPTELPGDPFFIKQTWPVGGDGNILSAMLLDPAHDQIFLAYQLGVVVEDLESGAITGRIAGVGGVNGIALDSTGEFGYISNGPNNLIEVFDRRTLQVVGIVPTAPNPSAVVYEPQSALVFAICTEAPQQSPSRPQSPANPRPRSAAQAAPRARSATSSRPAATQELRTFITVIDANTWSALANILLPAKAGFVQTGGDGHVYLSLPARGQILRIEAFSLAQKLRNGAQAAHTAPDPSPKDKQLRTGKPFAPDWQLLRVAPLVLDWSDGRIASENGASLAAFFRLDPACGEPRTAAVDENHLRLFVACDNMTLAVLNADNGDPIASLPTGPDTRAVAYDFDRRLVFAANAGGNGSLTVIRQHATDSYAVVQNLPTPHLARALAINPSTGLAYVVTDYRDAESKQEIRQPSKGNFLVSVIGH